jgi:hypothetical protein
VVWLCVHKCEQESLKTKDDESVTLGETKAKAERQTKGRYTKYCGKRVDINTNGAFMRRYQCMTMISQWL